MNILYIILGIMMGLTLVYLLRVIIGPSVWDRLLGLNLISSKIIVIIILFSSIHDSTFLLDFAILYSLFGFIGAIFIALFLSKRNLQKGSNLKSGDE